LLQGQKGRRMGNCRSHCRACHTHFCSDAAFDAHRRWPAEGRYCCDPLDDGRFAIKAQAGKCAIASGLVRDGVMIWTYGRTWIA
jgi:hypothetical protein